jgi:hypothetical protein
LVYAVKLTAKTMADARELIHLFRTGQIRPSESYQGGQNDPTRDALEERILELEVELAERNRVLVEVARIEWAIKNSPWPMFRKSAVVQQLQQIRQPSR